MRLPRMKIRLDLLSILIALIPSAAEAMHIRAPARRFGAAYSIKITIWRDSFSYVIPVWIRPDRAESSLDPGQMRLIGWPYKDFKADEVEISGETIPIRNFKSERSDLAVSPEFAKNCCMGSIGRDLLEKYRVYLIPGPPTYVQFGPTQGKDSPRAAKLHGLESLFSVNSPKIRWDGKGIDASRSELLFDLRKGEINFFGSPGNQVGVLRELLLSFDFIPGTRNLRVRGVKASEAKDAADFGMKPGSVVTELNGEPVSRLDRGDIVELLMGRSTAKLDIAFLRNPLKEEKSKITFDFINHAFTQTQAIPTPAGRDQNP